MAFIITTDEYNIRIVIPVGNMPLQGLSGTTLSLHPVVVNQCGIQLMQKCESGMTDIWNGAIKGPDTCATVTALSATVVSYIS